VPGVGTEGQVPAVDDEASRDRPGAGQLLGKGGRAVPVAEQERGARGTDAAFQHVPAADHVPPQVLGEKLVLLGGEGSRALTGRVGT
jgi:hypothetical protein